MNITNCAFYVKQYYKKGNLKRRIVLVLKKKSVQAERYKIIRSVKCHNLKILSDNIFIEIT